MSEEEFLSLSYQEVLELARALNLSIHENLSFQLLRRQVQQAELK